MTDTFAEIRETRFSRFNRMTVSSLRKLCKENRYKKYSDLNKRELITFIMNQKNVVTMSRTCVCSECKVILHGKFTICSKCRKKEKFFEMNIAIPDCFVSPYLKLSNGKNGHGERRLYTGDSYKNNEHICKKPWLIKYPCNYKNDIESILNDDSNFSKKCDNRKEIVNDNIDKCSNKLIYVVPQNGTEDVKRYYIGPDKSDRENIKLYDALRLTLIPKIYSLRLIESEDYFECHIIKNEDILKKPKNKKTSNVCKEWLTYLSNTYSIEIQHQDNKGEFQLRNPKNGYFWPVDGYHNCEIHRCQGDAKNPCKYNNHVWEFQGDYFHGNPSKYNLDDTFHGVSYLKKHNKDLDKKKFYEEKGYIVNIKWESEWVEEKKLMKKNNIKWY